MSMFPRRPCIHCQPIVERLQHRIDVLEGRIKIPVCSACLLIDKLCRCEGGPKREALTQPPVMKEEP